MVHQLLFDLWCKFDMDSSSSSSCNSFDAMNTATIASESSVYSCSSSHNNHAIDAHNVSSWVTGKVVQFVVITLLEALFCAFIDLLIEVPTLFAILTNTFQFAHLHICSDIPGSTIAFHNAIISLFRTLPEPSNTNIVWTNVPLYGRGGYVIRGNLVSSARCNSLSVYPKAADEVPVSLDLRSSISNNNNNSSSKNDFEVIVASEAEYASALKAGLCRTDTAVLTYNSHANWSKGFIALRNYLVPNGTRVVSPCIYHLIDNSIFRPAQVFVTGPSAPAVQTSLWSNPRQLVLLRLVIFNTLVLLINRWTMLAQFQCFSRQVIHASHSLPTAEAAPFNVLSSIATWLPRLSAYLPLPGFLLWNVLIILSGFCLALCLLSSMYHIGKRKLHSHWQATSQGGQLNKLFLASSAQSSEHLPSALHTYWFMKYQRRSGERDRPGTDILIRGRIDPAKQAFWSVVVYDEFGLPLPQYVNDQNVTRIVDSSSSNNNNNSNASNAMNGEPYEYCIRLTTQPQHRNNQAYFMKNRVSQDSMSLDTTTCSNSSSDTCSSSMDMDNVHGMETELDVSQAAEGYVLFRLVHPVDKAAVDYSTPTASATEGYQSCHYH